MSFLDRLHRQLEELQRERPAAAPELGEADIEPKRNAFLRWVYAKGAVEASPYSAHCADKLFFSRLIEEAVPGDRVHPKTRGLKELGANLPDALAREFPMGFVVKPVAGMNSNGDGVYLDEKKFLAEFGSDPGKFLPVGDEVSELTGRLSSGERYLAQEKIGGREQEYRLHTFEGRVVRGATYSRWDQTWDADVFASAEDQLQGFLHSLPDWLTRRQAWSVDFLRAGTGFRIVEINTNRGREKHWSGDLVIPDTLKAYVLHLEAHYGAKFVGAGGEALRTGNASKQMYLEKFGAEAVARHEALRRSLNCKKK